MRISLLKQAPPLPSSRLPPRLSRPLVPLSIAACCVAGLRVIVCQFELWHITGSNPSSPTAHRRTFKAPTVGSFCCSPSLPTVGSSVSRERHLFSGISFPCKTASLHRHPPPTTTTWLGCYICAAALRRATDRNYCCLSSEIWRPFVSTQPVKEPLSRVSKTNNISDFKG